MFQIATAIGIALANDDDYAFNFDNTVPMQGNPASAYRDTVFSELKELPKDWVGKSIWHEGSVVNPTNAPYRPITHTKDMVLDGYFQTEKYFAEYKYFIIDLFKDATTIFNLWKEYKGILHDSVGVHVRRGDYVDLGEWIGERYYYHALNQLWETVDIGNILVFSDDIGWCKDKFLSYHKNITFVEGLKDYEDMYLFSLCNHNVTANSSFSWWGAYLNKNFNKKVFMPKPWTTSVGDDIYPKGVTIVNAK
jgi:hypothetical protein